tara:strand:+ start:1827 stop:5555 length:3729 start_codon:yes stop_codon:yes gene_type:complete
MSQISIEPLSADELNQLQKSASSEALGDSIFEKPTYTPSEILIEQQMQNLLQTDDEGQEIQPQKLSLKDLENDKEYVDAIKKYFLDRELREKIITDTGETTFQPESEIPFKTFFFPEEATNENIVDDYLDQNRNLNNSIGAGMEIAWINSTKKKEKDAFERGDLKDAMKFSKQLENAAYLMKKTEQYGGFFTEEDGSWTLTKGKRFEGMSALQVIADIGETTATNVAITLSDPVTVFTAGVGRAVTSGAKATAGKELFKDAVKKAFLTGGTVAGAEFLGAAFVDTLVQNAEIELGIRNEIDYKRAATNGAIAAVTTGVVTTGSVYRDMRSVDKNTRGELTKNLKKVQKEQLKNAQTTNKRLKLDAEEIREKLAKSIEEKYGKESVLRDKEGKVKGINSKVIKESEDAQNILPDDELLDEALYEPSLNTSLIERTTASVGELIENVREGKIKFISVVGKNRMDELALPLQKNETVSERLLNILSNAEHESGGVIANILGKYGITQTELAAALFSEASNLGYKLGQFAQLSKIIGKAGTFKTVDDVATKLSEESFLSRNFNIKDTSFGKFMTQLYDATSGGLETVGGFIGIKERHFRKAERNRLLSLVSGVATAVRNNVAQVIRSGYAIPTVALELTLNPNRKASLRSIFAQIDKTFFNQREARDVTKFILDNLGTDAQRRQFYSLTSQYIDSSNKIAKRNIGQHNLKDHTNGYNAFDYVLDGYDVVLNTFNVFNRLQESIYRQGMFTASLIRQLEGKGIDYDDLLAEQGLKSLSKVVSPEIIAKAVDDALEFTYAARPKTKRGQQINDFMVNNYLTLVYPFPRFTIKALEYQYNHSPGGVISGIYRLLKQIKKEGRDQKTADLGFQQIAEGTVGAATLLFTGWALTQKEFGSRGSEWYKHSDGYGNEFDIRPYFPLTPYVYFGELINRYTEKRDGKLFKFDELIQAVSGANLRGAGSSYLILEDLVNYANSSDAANDLEFRYGMHNLGEIMGEIISGYGQPYFQFGDMYPTYNDWAREYEKNPDLNNDFVGNFTEGFSRPWQKRFGKLTNKLNFDDELPFRADPRTADIPENVLPFFKILFGANLTRKPPPYVIELNKMGFTYSKFMGKTNNAEIDQAFNYRMGIALNKDFGQEGLLEKFKEDYPNRPKLVSKRVDDWITDTRIDIMNELKQTDEGNFNTQLKFRQYNRASYRKKSAAKEEFRIKFGREPDLLNLKGKYTEDVINLLDILNKLPSGAGEFYKK